VAHASEIGDIQGRQVRAVRRIPRNELLRKLVHIGSGGLALVLRPAGPALSALLALGALAFNVLLLPRIGGRSLWRDHEHDAGSALGILLYPLTVLLLILLFWKHLEIAAAGWGILAFGDGMAAVVGIAFGTKKLPWNPQKSWAGSLAYVVFGTLAAASLLVWTAPARYEWSFALAIAGAATLLAAALESVPEGLDDNLAVPLLASVFLFGLALSHGRWGGLVAGGLLTRAAIGLGVNLVLAGLAWAAKTVDLSGVIGGILVGTVIYAFLDWKGFLVLLAFFVLGSAATKLGYRRKAAANLAQEKGGRRGARHAFANCGVAAVCALFSQATPFLALSIFAFAGAFATAAADTASSEIGQLLGRRTFLLTTLKPVPRGTEGAVSLEGTLAGIAAAAILASIGALVGLYAWIGVVPVVIAAFLGSTFESLVGAALEKRRLLDNEALNFLNTLVGAVLAAALGAATLIFAH
jgi:uncharacterized protein (TIGR00297 family)